MARRSSSSSRSGEWGSRRIHTAKRRARMPGTCFVLMPFEKEERVVYDQGIHPAVKKGGLRCVRADTRSSSGNIIGEIVSGIAEADLVIADISKLNANVFYELGITHAFGRRCILLVREGKKIQFDLHPYRHLKYRRSAAGLANLQTRLTIAIRESFREDVVNPVVDALRNQVAAPGCFPVRAIMWHLPYGAISIHVANCHGERLLATFPRRVAETIRELCRSIVLAVLPNGELGFEFLNSPGIGGPDAAAETGCSWDWRTRRIVASPRIEKLVVEFEVWEREGEATLYVEPSEQRGAAQVFRSVRREVEKEWRTRFAAQKESLRRLVAVAFGRRAQDASFDDAPDVEMAATSAELIWRWRSPSRWPKR